MRAVDEARSEWEAFLDSDDVWLPTKLDRQFEALKGLGASLASASPTATTSAIHRRYSKKQG
jgi:hypothetical protein